MWCVGVSVDPSSSTPRPRHGPHDARAETGDGVARASTEGLVRCGLWATTDLELL